MKQVAAEGTLPESVPYEVLYTYDSDFRLQSERVSGPTLVSGHSDLPRPKIRHA